MNNTDWKTTPRICKYCGESYLPKNSEQKYCTTKHRKKWHREYGAASNRTPTYIQNKIEGKPQLNSVKLSPSQHLLNSIGEPLTEKEILLQRRQKLQSSENLKFPMFTLISGVLGFVYGSDCDRGSKGCKNGQNNVRGALYASGAGFVGNKIDKYLENEAIINRQDELFAINARLNEIEQQEQITASISQLLPKITNEAPELEITEKKKDIISANEYMSHHTPSLGFSKDSPWFHLLGDVAPGFFMLVGGKPGQGKSTFSMKLAKHLVKFGKVLYIPAEQSGINAPLKQLMKRLNMENSGIDINPYPSNKMEELDKVMSIYDFVILDSVNHMRLDPDEIELVRKKHKGVSLIGIMQSTQDGKRRGSQKFGHNCDIEIEMKALIAKTLKNRFAKVTYIHIDDLKAVSK